MGSSPGFGSIRATRRPFGLAFAPAPAVPALASPRRSLVGSFYKRHAVTQLYAMLRPAGGARFQDLFHSPRRGAFHRSLTVLVRYRSSAVFSLGWWSAQLPTGFRVSGGTHVHDHAAHTTLRLRGSHPLRSPVPVAFGCARVCHARGLPPPPSSLVQPRTAAPAGLYAATVWAPPRSLATTPGILSFPRGTEMFQFPRFPPGIAARCRGRAPARVAPFGDPRITGCQRLPEAFRRVAASFIGRNA